MDSSRNIYFETILSQANGYMGIRGYPEERDCVGDTCREGYLAGVFSDVDEAAAEIIGEFPWPVLEMVSLPDLFATDILLDGTRFSVGDGTVSDYQRSLDLRNGVLRRALVWQQPGGRRTRLCFERFLSAANPHLACQRVTVSPLNWSGEVRVAHELEGDVTTFFRCGDKRQPHLPQRHFTGHEAQACGGEGVLAMTTRGTAHDVAVGVGMAGEAVVESRRATGFVQARCETVVEGGVLADERFVAVVTSRDTGLRKAPVEEAREMILQAVEAGFDGNLSTSESVWASRWERADVVIEGHERDQKVIRFNVFQLLQMGPFHTDRISIPARAYAYNRYRGLYFWDTEIFILPFYQWVLPDVARNLLAFRHHTLPGAKRNAAHWGGEGALYPWMTDSDTGLDNSIDARVWKLFHQVADIAYAADEYARTTGDVDFMLEMGLEILAETARFFMSRCSRYEDGTWHLEGTIGPDEDNEPGLDNGFTCIMARHNLRLAAGWFGSLGDSHPARTSALRERLRVTEGELSNWLRLSAELTVPVVPGTEVPLQDEHIHTRHPKDIAG
jgi:trehalose/maltose hydrolase-like predicted phosphorylase